MYLNQTGHSNRLSPRERSKFPSKILLKSALIKKMSKKMGAAGLLMICVVVTLFAGQALGKQSRPWFADKLGPSVNIVVSPGENVKLSCKGSGKPKPFTRWTKEGQGISRSSKYMIHRHFMLIRTITPEDGGVYKCEIENHRGSTTRTFTLAVSGSITKAPTINTTAENVIMRELKEEVEELKKQFNSLPRNAVHIHMHDGHNKDHVISTHGNDSDSGHNQHVHLHMHVQPDTCGNGRHSEDQDIYAVCHVLPNMNLEGEDNIRGLITLTQKGDKPVAISIQLKGFNVKERNETTLHGFHIHSYGDLKDSCNSLGPHYNPEGVTHAAKHASVRHMGDLGNIASDMAGEVNHEMEDSKISLHGPHSIMGRSVVIHENADDLGNGGEPSSIASGNAGSRLACCVITRGQPNTGETDNIAGPSSGNNDKTDNVFT